MIETRNGKSESNDKIESRVLLVTGGSRGIGQAIVGAFSRQGWTVASCATTVEGRPPSGAAFDFRCDVGDPASVKAGVAAVVKKFGRIDAIINNAGLAGSNPLEAEAPDDLWHQIINVNLNGTYYMTKQVLPHLPSRTGRVINIASVLALKGVPDQTAYCAAKHGVLGLTRAMAHYLGPRGITVNAICPGWVRTDMAAGRMREIGITAEQAGKSLPLGRIVEPAEVAGLALYLASEAAASITGQALTMDGGFLA